LLLGDYLKYSIIIPTLNEEKLLANLLEQFKNNSILSKYDAEIIISDGGSTDNTLQIAKKFTNNILLKNTDEKQNIAGGRNVGAKIANGKFLIFLCADVIFEDIIKFFDFLEKKFVDSSYLGMTCNVKIFPEEERTSDKIFHLFLNNYFYSLNILGLGMGRGECQVISKEIFEQFNGYNEELAAGEDFDLFRRLRKKGKILHARNILVYESPRRYRKYGYLSVFKDWFINSFYVVIKNKSVSTEWEQIR